MLSVDAGKYSKIFLPPRDDSLESIKRAITWYENYYNQMNVIKLIEQDFM